MARGLRLNCRPLCPGNCSRTAPPVEVHSHPALPSQTKCHQYWPDPPDVAEHGSFHIRCQSEDCTIAYVFREMLVTNTEVSGALAAGGPGRQLRGWSKSAATVVLGELFWAGSMFSPGQRLSKRARTRTHAALCT